MATACGRADVSTTAPPAASTAATQRTWSSGWPPATPTIPRWRCGTSATSTAATPRCAGARSRRPTSPAGCPTGMATSRHSTTPGRRPSGPRVTTASTRCRRHGSRRPSPTPRSDWTSPGSPTTPCWSATWRRRRCCGGSPRTSPSPRTSSACTSPSTPSAGPPRRTSSRSTGAPSKPGPCPPPGRGRRAGGAHAGPAASANAVPTAADCPAKRPAGGWVDSGRPRLARPCPHLMFRLSQGSPPLARG